MTKMDSKQLERATRFVQTLCALVAAVPVDQVSVSVEEVQEPQGVVTLLWVHLPSRRERGMLIGHQGRVARDLRSLYRTWCRGVGIYADATDVNIHRER